MTTPSLLDFIFVSYEVQNAKNIMTKNLPELDYDNSLSKLLVFTSTFLVLKDRWRE